MRSNRWQVALAAVALGLVGGCKRRAAAAGEAPAAATDPNAAVQVAIGGSSACAVLAAGTVQCWGANSYGQLGDGGNQARLVPAAVPGLAGVAEVDVGDAHACARKADGSVWCWGSGSDGAIGNGARLNARSPVQVGGLPAVRDIGTSGGNTCAVAVDGGTWCWGSNVFGESAQPAGVREVLTPTRIAGLGPAVEVDTGQNHTCARLADGTVWCWGGSGPLGDGASVQRHSPVQVQGVAGATALAVGQNHNCALVVSGAVTCWGSTGGGGGGMRATPVALSAVVSLTAGNYSTCATLADGVAQCWGTNYEGKFLVPATQRSVMAPTPLPGVAGVSAVALGIGYQCALQRAGSLSCWGTLRQPGGGRSVLRTATVYPVTFDGRSPAPPLVPDPPSGGSVVAAANALANAAADTRQAINAAQAAAPTAAPAGAQEPLEARIARTTAVTATPREVTVGGQRVTAERCALDGPALLKDSGSTVLPSLAFDRRGALYLVDGDQHVRRYDRVRGQECRFAVDPAFGTGGVLTLPSSVSHVSVDRRGAVVASGVLGSFVIEDGAVTTRCNRGSHGYVSMSSRGPGYGVFPGSPVRLVEYDDGACTVTPWTYENPFRSVSAVGFDGRNILLAGSMPDRGGNQVAILDDRGRERARFGSPSGTAADGFCWVHGLSACRAGVCAIDTNCDRIHLWTTRGVHVGNVGASELLGVSRPWLSAIEPGRRGEVFIATGVRREPTAANVYEGVLFRVSGL
nr:hypothetical protein [Deltaproteobacteria bacterium]